MKKLSLIFIISIIVATGTYFYIRFVVLKAKDFKPDYSKSKSVADLRPALIAKLQQLVKDASGGLYKLSIGKIDPHVSDLSIDISDAVLTPDSAMVKNLDKFQKLPGNVFKISLSSLHIDGIQIKDLLSKDHLSFKHIFINAPGIEVYYQEKRYNKQLHVNNDPITIYKRIMRKMKSISINTIEVKNGTFIMHTGDKNNTTRFNNLSVIMKDVLIDSSTQFDTKRFLFARQAMLSAKNFYGRTPDNLYYFKCASVNVSTAQSKIDVLDFELHTQLNQQQLKSHSHDVSVTYKFRIPRITLYGIDGMNFSLLSEDHLSLKDVFVKSPVIEVSQKDSQDHKQDDFKINTSTIYQKIVKKMKRISIDTFQVVNATLITHTGAKNRINKLNHILILMKDILIDSSTQYDTKRFLFAKKATLSAQNLCGQTPDNMYYFRCASVNISTAKDKFTALNFELHPTIHQQQFESDPHNPGESYKFTIPQITVHGIDGIDINGILSKDHLSLKNVLIKSPVIGVYEKENQNSKTDTRTIYQKIVKKMKRISIDTFQVVNGTLITHAKNRINKLNQIWIVMKDILIDSSTQYDTKRFLFAKQATLSTKNFYGRTTDNLYYFKCASINISTTDDKITALGFELHPRFNQKQFEGHLRERKEMYNLSIPKITLDSLSWSKLCNQKSIVANEAVISNGSCKIFLDRSLPFRHVKINNFPHQILMRIPVPISIAEMQIRQCNLAYSEHNPGMDKTGTVYIDDMNGEITNLTNMPEQIKKQHLLVIKSSGLFMHKIPMTNGFVFDLSKYTTGNFTMDLNIGDLDSAILNPITEPMGEFMIKKGSIQRGIAHVIGDNFKGTGKGELLYKNLYLIGFKKDKNKSSGIKKKSLISFLGNVFLIKNDNPEKGKKPRIVDFYLKRESKTTFFSLVWGTIYSGILKTIGLPQSFADKSY
jgi:hypothetical protein